MQTATQFPKNTRIKPLTGSGKQKLTIEFTCNGNADDELAAAKIKEFLVFHGIQALAEKL